MTWTYVATEAFDNWLETVTDESDQDAIVAAIRALQHDGPPLGRPLVDRIHGSSLHNMKELRPLGTSIRILFAFDPARQAVLLVGGSKEGAWNEWYDRMIPIAEGLYAAHLRALERKAAKDGAERARRQKKGKT